MKTSSRGGSDGLFVRSPANPLLTATRWPYRVNSVMNAAATMVGGETVLLCRVEDRRGFSHLTVARSLDGQTGWRVDPHPLIVPMEDDLTERWGVEDARVTRVDELDAWIIAYTAYGPGGPGVALATTQDFHTVERLGTVRVPEDKNAALLPRRIDGDWVLFHRPRTVLGHHADIWLSRSADLRSWQSPEPVMSAREGGFWDGLRIGMGPPPLETEHGWLVVYHGVRQTVAGALYRAGLAMLELENPTHVLHRCQEWVLGPTEMYETTGDVPGVVFPCGMVHDPATDELRLYYGAADTCIGMATAHLPAVLDYVRGCPPG